MKLGTYTLQAHQERAVQQLTSHNTRGLILYFATGAGKTLTSIASAQALMAGNSRLSVVVVAPAALLINFKNELKKYDVNPKPYTLLSLQGFVKEYDFRNRDDKVKKLTDRILIVDGPQPEEFFVYSKQGSCGSCSLSPQSHCPQWDPHTEQAM